MTLLFDDHGRDWDAKFHAFHEANPQVFRLFAKLARKALAANRKVGARCIGERLRWEFEIRLHTSNVPRLNNFLWPRYARMLAEKDDRFRDFFEFRRTT